MSQIIKPVMLDETGQEIGNKIDSGTQTTSAKMTELIGKMQTIAEALESVHSVNGMTGDVVIDASSIRTNKLDSNSKTIKQVLDEEQNSVTNAVNTMNTVISKTPTNVRVSLIENEDYKAVITLSTPS